MKGLTFHERPRSLGAQRARMAGRWPLFQFSEFASGFVRWTGPLQPLQQIYRVSVFWDPASAMLPYVVLEDPALEPKTNCSFEEIPHLIYDKDNPERSGLCLFDPGGKEWSNHRLIADTTIPWAAHWLHYYELWHVDGVWRGGGVGPESIAAARAASLHGQAGALSQDTKETSPLASR